MEKAVWQGTFAEAEQREDKYWAGQSEQYRLSTLIEIRQIMYEDADKPMVKVAFKRHLGEEE